MPDGEPAPKAIIVPHAGYVYSGAIAGSGVRAAAARSRGRITRVVLLGPAHRVPVDGLAVSSADAFATPLGAVPVDDALRRRVLALPGVTVDDRAHARRALARGAAAVPPAASSARSRSCRSSSATRARRGRGGARRVWGGPETLIVVSSDLSHYHDYATARARDRRTAAAIVAADAAAIADDDACGARPIRGLLVAARRHGLAVRLLDLRSSGDTAGDRDRVVGYGAFTVSG